MKLGLFLIPLTLFSISEAKPRDNNGLLSSEDTLRFRIEIPAGTKQKWEFNDEIGEIKKDYTGCHVIESQWGLCDWLGDRGDHYSDAIGQCSFSHQKFVQNIKELF